jgi:hypothetical protein
VSWPSIYVRGTRTPNPLKLAGDFRAVAPNDRIRVLTCDNAGWRMPASTLLIDHVCRDGCGVKRGVWRRGFGAAPEIEATSSAGVIGDRVHRWGVAGVGSANPAPVLASVWIGPGVATRPSGSAGG